MPRIYKLKLHEINSSTHHIEVTDTEREREREREREGRGGGGRGRERGAKETF